MADTIDLMRLFKYRFPSIASDSRERNLAKTHFGKASDRNKSLGPKDSFEPLKIHENRSPELLTATYPMPRGGGRRRSKTKNIVKVNGLFQKQTSPKIKSLANFRHDDHSKQMSFNIFGRNTNARNVLMSQSRGILVPWL